MDDSLIKAKEEVLRICTEAVKSSKFDSVEDLNNSFSKTLAMIESAESLDDLKEAVSSFGDGNADYINNLKSSFIINDASDLHDLIF
jgi:hypothetical protein